MPHSGEVGRKTTALGMNRVKAVEAVREQAALARRQSESPYNHVCKELHVRKVFGEMADALDAVVVVLEKGG